MEVDVGAGRCGVAPGEPALRLAQAIARASSLRFGGLHAYHGAAQHRRTPQERRAAIAEAVGKVRATIELLKANGIEVPIVTGAGTGTYLLEAGSGVYNEIQPGSYVFMDADYGRNLGEDGLPVHEFEQSLFILATVMSHPVPERAVVDVGLKAHSVDSGMPSVVGVPGAEYLKASDEHGVIALRGTGRVESGAEDSPHSGPLRPDRESVRLAGVLSRRPGGSDLANLRARGVLLIPSGGLRRKVRSC